jgi:oligopeptidase A
MALKQHPEQLPAAPSTRNPLLCAQDLPPFSEIRPEDVVPALDAQLRENRKRIGDLLNNDRERNWSNLVRPLEEMQDRLDRLWSPVRHLNAVADTEALRAAYNEGLDRLTEYATDLSQNEALYRAYEEMDKAGLDAAQQQVVAHALRDLRLSGVSLEPGRKRRFKAIQQQLSRLQSRFEQNLLNATQAWSRPIPDARELSGLPDAARAMLHQNAATRGHDGWLVNLEFPSYHAVVTYAHDRSLREEVYIAYHTRASDQGPHAGEWDNSAIMEQILALRHESAGLVGFEHYTGLSLATKMAESPERVQEFLYALAERARPAAQRELSELRAFAREQLDLEGLEAWDIAHVSERLRRHRFQLSQEDLKPYFSVDRVLQGLFELVGRLYGISIRPLQGIDVWHPQVRFYAIHDREGVLRGRFYLDLYARPHKRGGAWMDECSNRMRRPDGLQTPVAFVTCNATPPVDGRPSLLTHDEVITLFHEFGHGLHHLLTRVDYPSVAGIHGVEWDAVEPPSQFMENWCWEREALDLFARHYASGEALPEALYDRLVASRHFNAGMQMLRQLEFAIFDFRLHLGSWPGPAGRIQALLGEVREQVSVIRPRECVRFQHGFAHIFAGGYAAGYFSYKWAEVLSADAFAAFEEQGLFDPKIGLRFLHNILERGGSASAMALFKAFRGREPSIDALLRHSGLAA